MPFYVGAALALVSALAVRYALTHRPIPEIQRDEPQF
jgi:hypothetical protein